MIDGTLDIQDTELFRGLALDDGTGSKQTDAEGGGVLVNPGATLNVTSCMFKSNAASGTATSDRDGGHNVAGGGIYAAAGSSLNITGLTSFVNNRRLRGTERVRSEPVVMAVGRVWCRRCHECARER